MQDRFEHGEKLPPKDKDVQRLTAPFFFLQPPEDLGRRQADGGPHAAEGPPGQHVAWVVRPCVDAPKPNQHRERHDGQPDPRPRPPRAAPAYEWTEAEEVPYGRPDGDHRDGVGARETVAGLVYELQGGRWPGPVEENLEEHGQHSR